MSRAALALFALMASLTAERAAAVDLASELAALANTAGRQWLAWEVPANSEGSQLCCFDHRSTTAHGCRLDERLGNWGNRDDERFPAGSPLAIYVAVERGRIERLLAVSASCPVDERSESVRRLADVAPAASVELLAGLARPWRDDLSDLALAALGHHATAAATSALTTFARDPAADSELREQAIFWLGLLRGAEGLAELERLLTERPGGEPADPIVFAISQNPGGTEALLVLVRRPEVATEVRRQALFWLGQSDDPRALEEISRLLAR